MKTPEKHVPIWHTVVSASVGSPHLHLPVVVLCHYSLHFSGSACEAVVCKDRPWIRLCLCKPAKAKRDFCVGLCVLGAEIFRGHALVPLWNSSAASIGGVSGHKELLLPVPLLLWSSLGPPCGFLETSKRFSVGDICTGPWQLLQSFRVPSWGARITCFRLLHETFLSGIYSTMLGLPKGGPHRCPAAGLWPLLAASHPKVCLHK